MELVVGHRRGESSGIDVSVTEVCGQTERKTANVPVECAAGLLGERSA